MDIDAAAVAPSQTSTPPRRADASAFKLDPRGEGHLWPASLTPGDHVDRIALAPPGQRGKIGAGTCLGAQSVIRLDPRACGEARRGPVSFDIGNELASGHACHGVESSEAKTRQRSWQRQLGPIDADLP